jgi:glyoxylase-like metal-dependent hydrolase (beta-lactamase superfamily II)
MSILWNRPDLTNAISINDFKNFYWLKSELISFCHANGISATGGKIEIANRIEYYLTTGKVIQPSRKPAPKSSFNWKDATLDLNTQLTDNYRNTENVRTFMTLHIGPHFKFNTMFMNWAKANAGKSLNDAIDEWKRINSLKRNKGQKAEIAPQFEYNRYIRDFMEDNPGMTIKDAIKHWKVKRGQAREKIFRKGFEFEIGHKGESSELKTKKGTIIYQLLTGRSNSYLISTPGLNILVDTGKSSAYKRLLAGLNSFRLKNNRIDYLILTHTHFDHCQNAAMIKEKYQCRIMLSEKEKRFIRHGFTPFSKGTDFFTKIISAFGNHILWKRCRYMLFTGDVLIKDSFYFENLYSDIRIIKTEGHSQGSISILVDNEIAIVGDAIFGVLKNSAFPPFADNPMKLVNSWKILLNTGCEIFLPGHGGIITRGTLQKEYDKYSKVKSIAKFH